jgi:hypothetical protein
MERTDEFEIPPEKLKSPEDAWNVWLFVTVNPRATLWRLVERLVIPPVIESLWEGLVPVSV